MKVFFESNPGLRAGVIEKAGKSIVIMCHGLGSNKDRDTYTILEKIFNDHHLSTFRFDFFGHGESDGHFTNLTITHAVDDIGNALEYCRSQGFSSIGLIGASFGGLAAIIAAGRTKGLFGLGLKSPVSDCISKLMADPGGLEEWKKKGYHLYRGVHPLGYSFCEDGLRTRSYESAKNIACPTIIIHGSADESVPLAQSIKLQQIIPAATLRVIDGANHRYSKKEDFDEMIRLLSEFIISCAP